MVCCINIDRQRRQFCLEDFPNTPLDYQETPPGESSELVCLQISDKEKEKIFSVFIKQTELKKIGISKITLKQFANGPEKLPKTIKWAAKIDSMLQKAAAVASEHLSDEFLKFFTDERAFANRVISSSMVKQISHLSKEKKAKGVPGMYFQPKESSIEVFINLKKTPPLGTGSYGKVRKVLRLSAPQQTMLVAKKVFKNNPTKNTSLHFEREIRTLRDFANKRGIISLIAGGCYDGKYAIFLPIYECDLFAYFQHRFRLTMSQKLSMVSQWLEGLATIAEKGVHGDLSPKNLLIKRIKSEKIEAVISDFGTFRPFGQEEYGLTTLMVRSPEYFAKQMVTSKQDVWAIGISLYEIFSKKHHLPFWNFDKKELETQMTSWISALDPAWILNYFAHFEIPPFLVNLINAMLDPRHNHRLSAQEAFEQFSKESLAYLNPAQSCLASSNIPTRNFIFLSPLKEDLTAPNLKRSSSASFDDPCMIA